jgi:hypothetical protein
VGGAVHGTSCWQSSREMMIMPFPSHRVSLFISSSGACPLTPLASRRVLIPFQPVPIATAPIYTCRPCLLWPHCVTALLFLYLACSDPCLRFASRLIFSGRSWRPTCFSTAGGRTRSRARSRRRTSARRRIPSPRPRPRRGSPRDPRRSSMTTPAPPARTASRCPPS